VPAFVVEALVAHRAAGYGQPAIDGLVFTGPQGSPLDVDNFRNRQWAQAVKHASLEGFRIHDLRHTCASLAIAAGADVKVLQRMLGHASAAMTLDLYGHLMPGQAEAVAERLDAAARGTAKSKNSTRAKRAHGTSAVDHPEQPHLPLPGLHEWRRWDSNPRPSGCKPDALAN